MNNRRRILSFVPYLIVAAIVSFLISSVLSISDAGIKDYTTFKNEASQLKDVTVEVETWQPVLVVTGRANSDKGRKDINFTIPNTPENVKNLDEQLTGMKAKINYVNGETKVTFGSMLVSFLPTIVTLGLFYFVFTRMAGGSQGGMGPNAQGSKARLETNIKTRFADVAGADEEIEEVKEIVDYLKHPTKYQKYGAKVPKGVLMEGPPGTGKTLIARALAGESNVPFYSISGSDFSEMFVGVGAKRARDLFKQAKATAPCIIFIDEIDAVGLRRGSKISGTDEQTLNQILVEMDGMEENTGIVVIAATNRADVLDPALVRSGRFDRVIKVSLPDKKGRLEILKVHAKNKSIDESVDLEQIAIRTPGFSGADLANILNEATILMIREKRETITMNDIDEAIDRVMMGPAKKSRKYSKEEKELVAYHEAGHAIIGLKLKDAPKVRKITIIPRGDAGGYNLMLPEEEKFLPTKKSLEAQIASYMGGRVAEQLIFNDISAGASNDIQQATRIAKSMVTLYGMSELGSVQYIDPTVVYIPGSELSAYSDETATKIDGAVAKIIEKGNETAQHLISENIDLLHLLAKTLIEQETITEEEIKNLEQFGSLTKPTQSEEIVVED